MFSFCLGCDADCVIWRERRRRRRGHTACLFTLGIFVAATALSCHFGEKQRQFLSFHRKQQRRFSSNKNKAPLVLACAQPLRSFLFAAYVLYASALYKIPFPPPQSALSILLLPHPWPQLSACSATATAALPHPVEGLQRLDALLVAQEGDGGGWRRLEHVGDAALEESEGPLVAPDLVGLWGFVCEYV